MTKRTLTTIIIIVFLLLQVSFASANAETDLEVQPQSGIYTWMIYSTSNMTNSFGSWSNGPQGWGPSALGMTTEHSVTHSYSGTLKVSKGSVEAAVGYVISGTYSYGTSYTVYPPANQQWQIKYRPSYKRKSVTQRSIYFYDGGYQWLDEYSYLTTYGFDYWSYDWVITGYR